MDAYARALAEYLIFCERDGVDPVTAGRAQVVSAYRVTCRCAYDMTRCDGLGRKCKFRP